MTPHIQTWTDGHLALRIRAYETRGYVVGAEPNPSRWPRTTGADLIAVAAIVDPAVRANATPGLLRRWYATLDDLGRIAIRRPAQAYSENRAFWSAFESVATFLDDIGVPSPPPVTWDALLHRLAVRSRNVGPTEDGPIAHFDNIHTYDDLYVAQLEYLGTKRGVDTLPPPDGVVGATLPIPRTTNNDVLQLATYWSDALGKVPHEMGHDGVVARWQPILADVDALAKPGKPDDVYPKNNEFWRELQRVAIQVAVSNEAPTKWDLAVTSVKDSVHDLPDRVEHVIEDGAHAVGSTATEIGRGLLEGLGAPVLIGAGLLGLLFFSRRRGGRGDLEAE